MDQRFINKMMLYFFGLAKRTAFFMAVWALFSLYSCDEGIHSAVMKDGYPDIYPDYKDVTIPVNIAPLNFILLDQFEKIEVQFLHDSQIMFRSSNRRNTKIPADVWRSMLQKVTGSAIRVQVYARQSGKWYAYQPFEIHVSPDSIDPYIAYRLIDPGYELWDQMGIYQRNLSTFNESVIFTNRITGKNCINCHSFHHYHPDRMMFHSRGGKFSGTFLLTDGKMQRVDTKTEHAASAGTYPAWHPSGNFIAFSSNVTRQAFHVLPGKKIEVYDMESDLLVWDIKNNAMLRDPRFTTKNVWETFPAWSPDGKWLYYCFADEKNVPFESSQIKYGLCRVDFDVTSFRFGVQIDTILHPATSGISVSFPRLSPDGRYLLFTASAYGTFPIWHKEANLEMIDLVNSAIVNMQTINSDEADSYHAWSSNSRWIVFSSRRIDGLYTRLFFAYLDSSGRIHKPFLLPQKKPKSDMQLLRSYNVPEFIKGKVVLNPYEIGRTLKGETVNLREVIHKP